MIEYQSYVGGQIEEVVGEVARLRITLFRDYPYLYDGNEEYERAYLAELTAHAESLVLVARAGGAVVAAATALPLDSGADILKDVVPAFRGAGLEPGDYFYYSEILVERAHRHAGIAGRFYAMRRDHALGLGYAKVCFMAVERGEDFPRPADYFDPSPMWQSMGFVRHPEIAIPYHWPTLTAHGTVDLEHRMVFWSKPLSA